jgi:enterochelin esterase-like enzyme
MGTFRLWSFFLVVMVVLAGCAVPATDAPGLTAVPILPVTLTPLPTSTPQPDPPGCAETKGRVEVRSIETDQLPDPWVIRVYLPPCYDVDVSARTPVLILLHGQSSSDDQWDRLGADEAADALIASGQASPFLIVMPREVNYLQDAEKSPYGTALAQVLVPWIDREYRTLSDRSCRALGGLSRGAGWAIHTGMTHMDLFAAIGGHSPAVFPGDTSLVPYWVTKLPAGELPRVYLDAGDLDKMRGPASMLDVQLTKYGVPHEFVVNPGAHNEEYWGSHVGEYLRWYTGQWNETCVQQGK